ncbi:MAG TPA: SCP2 sterol-binding domain-containing protein [bacterium]|nr:SCP2 sterol-binding domain-containing protein [bacterium]
MPVFKDTDDMYATLVPFFNKLKDHPDIGPKIMASGLVIQFRYTDPDAVITIDCPKEVIIQGEIEGEPTVTMSMKSLTAHKFWLGKVSLMVAITKRDIVAKGPIPAIMKLLPIIKNSYAMYEEYLKEIGKADKITDWN